MELLPTYSVRVCLKIGNIKHDPSIVYLYFISYLYVYQDIKKRPNLTDSQYSTILQIINDKRKRQRSLRDVLNAMFYLLKTGCQWCILPSDFPNWERGYYYFQKWSRDGTIEKIHEVLRKRVRIKRGRYAAPNAAMIDSQHVKVTEISGVEVLMAARRLKDGSDTS